MSGPADRAPAARRGFAERLFGYDVFISFALGPPPRGSQSYASDLARRLRERDFSVFFSEDEAPPGQALDSTLRRALRRSRILVVIANRGTLAEPRWIRTEVEEFRRIHPDRPVIPISVGGALQDAQLAALAQPWLGFADRIWLDETEAGLAQGMASLALVERLATAPAHRRANQMWRWIVRATVASLALLLGAALWSAKLARDSEARARAELRRAQASRLAGDALAMLEGLRSEGHELAIQQLVAAQRLAPQPDVDAALLNALLRLRALQRLIPLDVPVTAVAFSADGRRVVSGDRDQHYVGIRMGRGNLLRAWDAASGGLVGERALSEAEQAADGRTPAGPAGEALAAPGVPLGGRPLAEGGWSVADPAAGASAPALLRGPGDVPRRALASADGRQVAVVGADGRLSLWEIDTGRELDARFDGHRDSINALAFSADGTRLASAGEDGTLRLWSTRPGDSLDAVLARADAGVSSVAVSRDGWVAAGDDFGFLRLWDAQGAPREPGAAPLGQRIAAVAFSPDGRRLASTAARVLRVQSVDAASAAPLDIETPVLLWALAWSADGQRIVGGGNRWEQRRSVDHGLYVWDSRSGRLVMGPLLGHSAPVASLAMDPRGRQIVSGGNDQVVRRWDAATGAPVEPPLTGHMGQVAAVAFDRDGRRIVSVAADAVRLWDAATGRLLLRPLMQHAAAVKSAATSPDGEHAVTGGDDGVIRVWHTATGEPVGGPLLGHRGTVWSLAFAPDGRWFYSVGSDRTVRRWPAPPAWADLLCTKVGRNMSRRHWAERVSAEIGYTCQCPGLPIAADDAASAAAPADACPEAGVAR